MTDTEPNADSHVEKVLHYAIVAGLIVGMSGLLLSASLQAWRFAAAFVVGLAFLLYTRTKYDEVLFHV